MFERRYGIHSEDHGMIADEEGYILMPEPEEVITDMPFDAAVFDAVNDQIIAVRGGYVFQCDKTTGQIGNSARFAYPAGFGPSCLMLSGGVLYVGFCAEPMPGVVGTDPLLTLTWSKGIFLLNPATLATTDFIDLVDELGDDPHPSFAYGPFKLGVLGGFIYCLSRQFTDTCYFLVIDPGTNSVLGSQNFGESWGDFAADAGRGKLWVLQQGGDRVDTFLWDGAAIDSGDIIVPSDVGHSTGRIGMGIEYVPGADKLYIVQRTKTLIKADPANPANANVTTIDLVDANFSPLHARYNAVDELLYIPGGKSNSVAVLDPTDDSFDVVTGFDSPLDVVFTDAKAFAVQSGLVGLKEIVL